MKKKQVNEILIAQARRRNVIFSFIVGIVFVTFFALVMFLVYFDRNKTQFVNYNVGYPIPLILSLVIPIILLLVL